MENRKITFHSRTCNLKLGVYPGHFATRHSHVNYFIDLTTIKVRQSNAEEAANAFKDVMLKALSLAKYEVVDAVPTEGEEGGFDVTVSVEPLKMFDGATAAFQEQKSGLLSYGLTQALAGSPFQVLRCLMV